MERGIAHLDQYDVLRIEIDQAGDGVVAARLSDGQEQVELIFTMPFSPADVDFALGASGGAATKMRLAVKGENLGLDPMRSLGAALFSALFEGRGRPLFQRGWDNARRAGRGLLLHFRHATPELESLPWEYLHDGRDYLGLMTHVQIARDCSTPQAIDVPPRASDLRVCVVAPQSVEDVVREQSWLAQAETETSALRVFIFDAGDIERLRAELAQAPFDVLHVIAPGEETPGGMGSMRLATPTAAGYAISSQLPIYAQSGQWAMDMGWLAAFLREMPTPPRLALFNRGYTARLARHFAQSLPAVIGMRGEIMPESALTFGETLYRALLAGRSLEQAMSFARRELSLFNPGSRDWGAPMLYEHTVQGPLLAQVPQTAALPAKDERAPDAPPDDPAKAREWKRLQTLLELYRRNLAALEAQQTSAADPYLAEQIADLQARIEATHQELAALQTQD
jgi:hypothetical protein